MARKIEFEFDGVVIGAEMVKVDRDKLYGSVELDTRTLDGNPCTLATLASDGRTLVPSGGTALGYLNQDGEWVPRAELVAVDLAGSELARVESSFKAPIPIAEECSLDEFLDHGIRLVYLLDVEDGLAPELSQSLSEGTIFKVPFSYRGGVSADPAFLLADKEGQMWFLIGNEHEVRMMALEQAAVCVDVDADEHPDADAGDLDFGMM